jgi:hypothetical protein
MKFDPSTCMVLYEAGYFPAGRRCLLYFNVPKKLEWPVPPPGPMREAFEKQCRRTKKAFLVVPSMVCDPLQEFEPLFPEDTQFYLLVDPLPTCFTQLVYEKSLSYTVCLMVNRGYEITCPSILQQIKDHKAPEDSADIVYEKLPRTLVHYGRKRAVVKMSPRDCFKLQGKIRSLRDKRLLLVCRSVCLDPEDSCRVVSPPLDDLEFHTTHPVAAMVADPEKLVAKYYICTTPHQHPKKPVRWVPKGEIVFVHNNSVMSVTVGDNWGLYPAFHGSPHWIPLHAMSIQLACSLAIPKSFDVILVCAFQPFGNYLSPSDSFTPLEMEVLQQMAAESVIVFR